MDHRRKTVLRAIELVEQPLDAAERKVDLLRMERGEHLQQRLKL